MNDDNQQHQRLTKKENQKKQNAGTQTANNVYENVITILTTSRTTSQLNNLSHMHLLFFFNFGIYFEKIIAVVRCRSALSH